MSRCHACMPVPCRHSGPQGKVVPLTIIDDPAGWKSKDWEGREAEYTYSLTAHDVAELHSAVAALRARGVAAEDDIIAVRFLQGRLLPTMSAHTSAIAFAQGRGRIPACGCAHASGPFHGLSCSPLQLTKEDYALPTLGPKLVELAKSVTLGRGFQLLRCACKLPDAPLCYTLLHYSTTTAMPTD